MQSHDPNDVTCRAIMDPAPAVLAPATTFAAAVQRLLDERLLAMPVVDAGGRYLGLFRKNLVISTMLPQVAVHSDRFSQVVRMIDAGLLRDNLRDIRDRYALIAQDPVASHLDKDAPVLRPDQSLVTALYHLYRGRNFLPVVDPANSRLLGVVSTWDVLETMRGGA